MNTATLTDPEQLDESQWDMLGKLTKDLRTASEKMGRDEARYLVDAYYQLQKMRIACAAQVRSQDGEPCDFLSWLGKTVMTLERSCQSALGRYAKQWAVGAWLQSICGVGPVISAGLLAHIDIRRCKTFGQLWRFAGMDPTCKWEKKTKRPWNADLKCLVAFKLGECFVKVQNNEKDYYGTLYRTRKDSETERNAAGGFTEQAANALAEKNWNKSTEAYGWYTGKKSEDGSTPMLPPAHIHARARRYAVKMFLSHLHHVMHWDYYGEAPPIPYVLEHPTDGGNHRHYLEPPNWPDQATGRGLREMLEPGDQPDG